MAILGFVEFARIVLDAEDLIIYKLRYYKISFQPKHTKDIQTILDAMAEDLDFPYIEHWVKTFDLVNEWDTAQNVRE